MAHHLGVTGGGVRRRLIEWLYRSRVILVGLVGWRPGTVAQVRTMSDERRTQLSTVGPTPTDLAPLGADGSPAPLADPIGDPRRCGLPGRLVDRQSPGAAVRRQQSSTSDRPEPAEQQPGPGQQPDQRRRLLLDRFHAAGLLRSRSTTSSASTSARGPLHGSNVAAAATDPSFGTPSAFSAASPALLVFAAPNNIICILAGATGMRARWFFTLNIAGTLVRLILIKRFGAVFEGPIDQILDLIARYRIPLLILSALGVAWTIFGEFRGDNSELKVLHELDQSIRDDHDEQ